MCVCRSQGERLRQLQFKQSTARQLHVHVPAGIPGDEPWTPALLHGKLQPRQSDCCSQIAAAQSVLPPCHWCKRLSIIKMLQLVMPVCCICSFFHIEQACSSDQAMVRCKASIRHNMRPDEVKHALALDIYMRPFTQTVLHYKLNWQMHKQGQHRYAEHQVLEHLAFGLESTSD